MSEDRQYLLPRDAEESKRLDTQHWIIERTLGYLVPPFISLRHDISVIDLGCGTGIWLASLAAHLSFSPHARLHGLDISSAQFPPAAELPHGVQLETHDVTLPFSPDLQGSFDLVHAQLVGQGFQKDQWQRTVDNVLTLLSPQGWIVWVEPDHLREARVVGASAPVLQALFAFVRRHEALLHWDRETDFALALPTMLQRSSKVQRLRREIVAIDFSEEQDVQQAVTTNTVKIIKHALDDFVQRGLADAELGLETQEDADRLLGEVREELAAGARYRYFYHVVSAQI